MHDVRVIQLLQQLQLLIKHLGHLLVRMDPIFTALLDCTDGVRCKANRLIDLTKGACANNFHLLIVLVEVFDLVHAIKVPKYDISV